MLTLACHQLVKSFPRFVCRGLVVYWMVGLGAACSQTIHAQTAESRPNILFILADDLGWADTTLYGHTRFHQTPNIARLAKRGMTLTRAYSASPLCSPTRSAVLTGLSPARTGITVPNCHLPQVVLKAMPGTRGPASNKAVVPTSVTRLATDYPTLPKALKQLGYTNGHFGKWHLGPPPYSPLEHGFDIDLPHHSGPGPAGSYVAPWKFADFEPDPGVPQQHIEDRMAQEAVAWMEKNRDRPFYLNYWMFSVHAPFDAKKALIEKHRQRVDPNDPQRSPTYAAMIESMDDAIGTLLDGLDRLQLSERTLIFFTADNGGNMYNEIDGTTPTSNSPLRGGKATMFEGGVRVPGVVVWPGQIEPGTRSDAIVQSEDYFPTILEALGQQPAEGQQFDGVSVLPALKGLPLERPPTFTYFPHDPGVPDWLPPACAVHAGDWKLIRLFYQGTNGAHRYLLFNLAEDLGEKNDLATKYPERVRDLDQLIERFLTKTHAVLPTPNSQFDPRQYHPELEGKQKPKANAKANPADDSDPKLLGWKARQCKVTVEQGTARIVGETASPFLGVSAGASGPATLVVRLRCAAAGEGKVEWIPPHGKAESRSFPVPAEDWQTLEVPIPTAGPLGIVRLYVPAQKQSVDVDWIELKPLQGKPKRWDF